MVVLAGCLFGCPGTKEKLATAALAEGCYLNSDCSDPLVCAFRRCHNACTSERDCPKGPNGEPLSCVASDRPYKVCLLPQESPCIYNTDCPPALNCAVDLHCHAECVTNRDCVSGQLCASGSCANPLEVTDAGMLVPSTTDAGTSGAAHCFYNTDCTAPLVCKSGACLAECRSIRDCRLGEDCDKGSCVLLPPGGVMTDGGSGSGTSCLLNSDCPGSEICGADNHCRHECVQARDCAADACCYQRSCRRGLVCSQQLTDGGVFDAGTSDGGPYCLNQLGCDDGNFCNGIELCENNICRPAEHPICDDFNPCTIDMCNSVAKVCSYASIGDAGDDDHDGHFAIKCGSGSDDCDDTNPNVYPGHPEDCDFIDNNCNGAVDEGLWRERSGSRISLHGMARYPWWSGKPSVVRVDGGFLAVVASDTIDGALEAFRLDNNLALVQGPVQVFKSSTQWVTPPGVPTVFGRRMLRPTVAINPSGEVLLSAWMSDAPGATGCPSGATFKNYTPVFQTDALLSTSRPWSPVAIDLSPPSCTANSDVGPSLSAATIAWSPGASRWIALWGTGQSLQSLNASYFDADGGVLNRHELLQAPDPVTYWDGYVPLLAPWMAAGPSNVLVAFTEWNSPSHLQYVLMDPSLGSRITPVADLFESGFVTAIGLAPRGYYFATHTSPGSATKLHFVSPVSGALMEQWGLESRTPQTTTPPRGANSTNELAIAPLADGLVFIQTDWPNADFGYMSSKNDGGYVKTTLLMPSTPRSGFAIIPMDSRTVGILWSDGELKRMVMECVP